MRFNDKQGFRNKKNQLFVQSSLASFYNRSIIAQEQKIHLSKKHFRHFSLFSKQGMVENYKIDGHPRKRLAGILRIQCVYILGSVTWKLIRQIWIKGAEQTRKDFIYYKGATG